MFFGIWFFQYFLSYIQGAYTIGVLLIGLSLWFVLLGIAVYKVVKLAIEKPKYYQRLIYIAIILILNFLSLAEPKGMVDWEKYEGRNLLVADREGTANCRTMIKLRDNNKFKYINLCFGVDFHFGTYSLSNDTLYFELKQNVGFMDKSTYATILKSKTDSTKYQQMILRQNHKDKRNINMLIKEVRMDELTKQNKAER